MTAHKTEPPLLFPHLSVECKPIVTKSRKYSPAGKYYIKEEIQGLLGAGIVEPTNSPWRAQVLVVKENGKKQMVVDYSQTVNRYTQLDAYPLPKIDELVNTIAKYNVFSTIDLRQAYYQIPLSESDRPYTAFEGDGKLLQFTRMPLTMVFPVTNGKWMNSFKNITCLIVSHT